MKMKHTITTDTDKGCTLEEVINDRIDCGRKWAEMGWFENDEFEDGHYYYFSNWYGSEGGYYNEETDELIDSGMLDSMEPEEREEFENKCWEFVEYPIDCEITNPHAGKDTCGLWVIRDEDERYYGDGEGVYQYFDGLFYQVGVDEVEGEDPKPAEKEQVDYIIEGLKMFLADSGSVNFDNLEAGYMNSPALTREEKDRVLEFINEARAKLAVK